MSGLLHRLLFPPKCAACKELTDWYVEHPALCNSCKKVWDNEKSDVCCICGERVSLCACLTEEMKRAKCASFHKLVYYYPQKRQIVQNRVLFSVKEKAVVILNFAAKLLFLLMKMNVIFVFTYRRKKPADLMICPYVLMMKNM